MAVLVVTGLPSDWTPPVLAPPGKAQIDNCPECKGVPGLPCRDCGGTGKHLWRACPLCGNIGWDYLPGTNRQRMACRIGCGFEWGTDHPGWLAQRLPD